MLVCNNWLKEEAEAHERRKTISLKSRTEDNCCISATETKGSSKVFAGNANAKQQISSKTSQNAKNNPLACVLCKCQHPIGEKRLFLHSIFKGEISPTQRTKLATEIQLCFLCLKGNHSFRICPHQPKCTHEGCRSTHNTLLNGTESVFTVSNETKKIVATLTKVYGND